MKKKRDDIDVEGIRRVATEMVQRLFGQKAVLSMTLLRDDAGKRTIVCNWEGGGWSGNLELHMEGARELTAKDLDGLLKVLN